jgi:hypothetical protein
MGCLDEEAGGEIERELCKTNTLVAARVQVVGSQRSGRWWGDVGGAAVVNVTAMRSTTYPTARHQP